MKYHVATACELGVFRANNEDSIGYGQHPDLGFLWMIVADGMGGHLAGEIASNMLVTYIKDQAEQLTARPNNGWRHWIETQIKAANTAIFECAHSEDKYKGMGTTGVLIVIEDNQCHLGWVGDSRSYLLNQGMLTQQTEDHSMIQYLLNKGAITAREAQNSNTKNLLTRALGTKKEVDVDILTQAIVPGDVIMLSTDGVHDYLTKDEIALHMGNFSLLTHKNNEQKSPYMMINQAIMQLSKDNLTLGLIKILK